MRSWQGMRIGMTRIQNHPAGGFIPSVLVFAPAGEDLEGHILGPEKFYTATPNRRRPQKLASACCTANPRGKISKQIWLAVTQAPRARFAASSQGNSLGFAGPARSQALSAADCVDDGGHSSLLLAGFAF